MEELKDGLRYCRIRKAELRKQAKGQRKVHLRDCLKQHVQVRLIKQTINREESKQMWHLIKRTVKDPHSPSVLKVQRTLGDSTEEYTIQEDVKNAIQQECKIRRSWDSCPYLVGKRPGVLQMFWSVETKSPTLY
jgi:hypothetical protein